MFLHVSVILFTGGWVVSVSVPEGGFLQPTGVSLPGGLCPEGSLSWGVSVLDGGVSVMETPRTVMSGQYASYWNVVLFTI